MAGHLLEIKPLGWMLQWVIIVAFHSFVLGPETENKSGNIQVV